MEKKGQCVKGFVQGQVREVCICTAPGLRVYRVIFSNKSTVISDNTAVVSSTRG